MVEQVPAQRAGLAVELDAVVRVASRPSARGGDRTGGAADRGTRCRGGSSARDRRRGGAAASRADRGSPRRAGAGSRRPARARCVRRRRRTAPSRGAPRGSQIPFGRRGRASRARSRGRRARRRSRAWRRSSAASTTRISSQNASEPRHSSMRSASSFAITQALRPVACEGCGGMPGQSPSRLWMPRAATTGMSCRRE